MLELPSTLENVDSSDQQIVADFSVLLGPEHFDAFVAELVEALESGSDPGHSGRSG